MQAVGGFRHAASDSERTHRTTVHLYDCPQQDKANKELLRKVVEDYKVGGLLFSGGLMQNQVMLTNEAQRMAEVPLMITFDGEWGLGYAPSRYSELSAKHGAGLHTERYTDL